MRPRAKRYRGRHLILQELRDLRTVNVELHALRAAVESIARRRECERASHCFSAGRSANIYAQLICRRKSAIRGRIRVEQYLRATSIVFQIEVGHRYIMTRVQIQVPNDWKFQDTYVSNIPCLLQLLKRPISVAQHVLRSRPFI